MIEEGDREYYEGQKAHRSGLEELDNPYSEESIEHRDWDRGFNDDVTRYRQLNAG